MENKKQANANCGGTRSGKSAVQMFTIPTLMDGKLRKLQDEIGKKMQKLLNDKILDALPRGAIFHDEVRHLDELPNYLTARRIEPKFDWGWIDPPSIYFTIEGEDFDLLPKYLKEFLRPHLLERLFALDGTGNLKFSMLDIEYRKFLKYINNDEILSKRLESALCIRYVK